MNLNALRLFYQVAYHGSFSRAAVAISISQPAISRAVAELEASLRSRLIDRGRRPLALTPAGHCLFGHAETIFGAERQAHLDLDRMAQPVERELRIAASPVLLEYVMAPLLVTFVRNHPDIRVHLVGGNLHSAAIAIGQGRVDLALVEGVLAGFEQLAATPWREQELVVLVPVDHPLANGNETIMPHTLSGHQFVHRESGSATAGFVAQLRDKFGIVPSGLVEAPDTATMIALAAAGAGITIAPLEAAATAIASGRLVRVPLTTGPIRRTNYIVRVESEEARADVQLMLAALREQTARP